MPIDPSRPERHPLSTLALSAAFALLTAAPVVGAAELLHPTDGLAPPTPHYGPDARSHSVRIDLAALSAASTPGRTLVVPLFDDRHVVAETRKVIRNPSGSTSWIGTARGDDADRPADGLIVLVTRDGVTVGSIRVGRSTYMLLPSGDDTDTSGPRLHALYEVDESSPDLAEEAPPTDIRFAPSTLACAAAEEERRRRGEEPQDDGSIHDLLVIYTPEARDAAGGTTAIENLIDLGVTETNISYETNDVGHRLRLVHTALTPTTEASMVGNGDPRDLLQDPDDGFMDEAHVLRDEYRADLVKVVLENGGGCGRAYIMGEVSLAFEEFAFCRTRWLCISPTYSFQHELGHLQAGRHFYNGDSTQGEPFTFNHGYVDFENSFYTIMGTNSFDCDNCTRRLAWSDPTRLDPETGAPTGVPEGEPEPCDMRQTLDLVAWTVANFRVGDPPLFGDGFESGDLTAWDEGVGREAPPVSGLR